MDDSRTYLTTEELSARIKYDCRTIRQRLKDSVLIEGQHYIKPFGRRKILYIWEAVEQAMFAKQSADSITIPMANGAVCNG
tara:strand:- start:16260 stop:16502 length:243 start_codon:yes stop_codon:yes gene_type:complete